jgi:hypothetical protein
MCDSPSNRRKYSLERDQVKTMDDQRETNVAWMGSDALSLKLPLKGRTIVDPGRRQGRAGEQRSDVRARDRPFPRLAPGRRAPVVPRGLGVRAWDDVPGTSGTVEDDRADSLVAVPGRRGGRGGGRGGGAGDEGGGTHWPVEDVHPFLDLLGAGDGRCARSELRRGRREGVGGGDGQHLGLPGDGGRVGASDECRGASAHGGERVSRVGGWEDGTERVAIYMLLPPCAPTRHNGAEGIKRVKAARVPGVRGIIWSLSGTGSRPRAAATLESQSSKTSATATAAPVSALIRLGFLFHRTLLPAVPCASRGPSHGT